MSKKNNVIALPEPQRKLSDTARYDNETITNLQHYAFLTQTQKIVLAVMVESLTSDFAYTDTEIAERAGVHRDTVRRCRHNAHFLDCLSESTKNMAKSYTPEVIQALRKAIVEKGNIRAMELMLRYTGDYIPKNQIESRNQNLNANRNISNEDPILEFVSLLCDRGWNVQRIHAEVDRAYQDLKEQNRVI